MLISAEQKTLAAQPTQSPLKNVPQTPVSWQVVVVPEPTDGVGPCAAEVVSSKQSGSGPTFVTG